MTTPKFRIVKTNAAAFFHDPVDYDIYSQGNPERDIYVVQRKTWLGWKYVDWYVTLAAADNRVLTELGISKHQLSKEVAARIPQEVVKEYD